MASISSRPCARLPQRSSSAFSTSESHPAHVPTCRSRANKEATYKCRSAWVPSTLTLICVGFPGGRSDQPCATRGRQSLTPSAVSSQRSVRPSAFFSARCKTTGSTGFPTKSIGSPRYKCGRCRLIQVRAEKYAPQRPLRVELPGRIDAATTLSKTNIHEHHIGMVCCC